MGGSSRFFDHAARWSMHLRFQVQRPISKERFEVDVAECRTNGLVGGRERERKKEHNALVNARARGETYVIRIARDTADYLARLTITCVSNRARFINVRCSICVFLRPVLWNGLHRSVTRCFFAGSPLFLTVECPRNVVGNFVDVIARSQHVTFKCQRRGHLPRTVVSRFQDVKHRRTASCACTLASVVGPSLRLFPRKGISSMVSSPCLVPLASKRIPGNCFSGSRVG